MFEAVKTILPAGLWYHFQEVWHLNSEAGSVETGENSVLKVIPEGPFATFSGAIEDINTEKNKLRVNVQIFGRATPVEVDVLQVEKI